MLRFIFKCSVAPTTSEVDALINGGSRDGVSPLHVSCVLLEIPSLWACISGCINVAGLVGVAISTVMAQIDTTTPAPHAILATDVVHGAITTTVAASSVVASPLRVASLSSVVCRRLAGVVCHGLHHVLHLG